MPQLSPLAPAAFPDLPVIEGVRFATTAAGVRYRDRTDVMLAALALLCLLGLIAPIRMLPVLVFEVVWKLLWFAAVVLPQWLADGLTPETEANLFAIALVVPYVLIIPWGRFFAQIGLDRERWR